MKKNVNEMKAEINRLHAEIYCVEKKMKEKNMPILIQEILNLREGVGEGYVDGDYYAPSRYYSRIEGVKNIRFGKEGGVMGVEIKCRSRKGIASVPPVGFVLTIKGQKYRITDIYFSSKATEEIDY